MGGIRIRTLTMLGPVRSTLLSASSRRAAPHWQNVPPLMFSRVRSRIVYLAKWVRFGVWYCKSLSFAAVGIAGKRVTLSFPREERSIHEWELGQILFSDCYRLAHIRYPVKTVLDVGANIGLFALSAREHFPVALIECYEPNPMLADHLFSHCRQIGATPHMEAIGSKTDRISLCQGSASIYSVSKRGGEIPQRAFCDAIARIGTVDVLKLDCEGAEWDIFTDVASWRNVRSLVMEYHLWARPGLSTDMLQYLFLELGFAHILIERTPYSWGFAFASKEPVQWARPWWKRVIMHATLTP
jgi:FkbM family methyltransferase